MSFDFYIVAFSIIGLAFAFIVFALAFSSYNKRVLKKSYMDTRIFIYTVMLSAIFFIGTIIYTNNVKSYSNITYIIYALIFIAYSISIMIMLLLTLKPLRTIEADTNLLAKGRKNLNIDLKVQLNLITLQKIWREYKKFLGIMTKS